VTRDGATPNPLEQNVKKPDLTSTHYGLLGLHPSASPQQIRQAYREKSKLYHPDTTELAEAIATRKFQDLNDAYATLSSPERRLAYDLKIGYSRYSVIQPAQPLNGKIPTARNYRSSAYLDPTDRPLSAGELFALFILGVTFVVCLILVVAVGLTRGEAAFQSLNLPEQDAPVIVESAEPSKSLDDATPGFALPTPDLSPKLSPVLPDAPVVEQSLPTDEAG
jgi:DnaJ domain